MALNLSGTTGIVGAGIGTIGPSGANITGVVTATAFVGSGADLTGVASTENIRTNTNATFLQNVNVSGTVTATSAKFTDDGSASPIVSIQADDANPYSLSIGNQSYNADTAYGLHFYNNNSGEGYFRHVGNSAYLDYHFSLHNGSTNKLCLKFEADDQSVELYNSGSKKFETTETGTVTTGISTAAAFIPSNVEQQLGNRNIWINGDARIAQKGTSIASLSSAGGYVAGGPDRTYVSVGNHGTWTLAQGTDAPPGFKNCVQWTATTGDASVASNAAVRWWQRWEGQDMQRFMKGTSSAKEFALSFWVKSSTTGAYAIELLDYDNSNRGVTRTYTINAADTWEHKKVILPADTTGAFDNDNAASFACEFWLCAGTDYTSGGADASWHAYADNKRAGGHTANPGASNNGYHRVTGIQLEAGSYCTPYEHKTIAEELRACQRYFYKTYPFNTAPGTDTATDICSFRNQMSAGRTDMVLNIAFPVPMRVTPTITGYSKNGNSNKYLESGIDYSGGNEGTFAGTVYAGRKYFNQLSSGNSVDSGNYAHFHFTAAAEV